MSAGGDWMVGETGKKNPARKIEPPTALELDDVEAFLDDAAGEGAKLVAGVKAGASAAEKLRACGLTGEALVLLVHAKCRTPSRGGKPPSIEAVQLVLEALFRLGEHLR